MEKATGMQSGSGMPVHVGIEQDTSTAVYTQSQRKIAREIGIKHYFCDLGELSTELVQKDYSGKKLKGTMKVGLDDAGGFIYGHKAQPTEMQLRAFADVFSQINKWFEALTELVGEKIPKTQFSIAQSSSVSISSFNRQWDLMQASPLLKLYNHEKEFVAALICESEVECGTFLNRLYESLEDYGESLTETEKREYWEYMCRQCESVSKQRGASFDTIHELLKAFAFTGEIVKDVETLAEPEAYVSISQPEVSSEETTPCMGPEDDLSAFGAAAPPLTPLFVKQEEIPPLDRKEESELSESFSQLSHREKQVEVQPQGETVISARKKERAIKTPASTKATKRNRRHKAERGIPADMPAKLRSKHNKRHAIDIVAVWPSLDKKDDSKHLCYGGGNNFYVCKSKDLENNSGAASDFWGILNVSISRLLNLFKWLGSSEKVFPEKERERSYQDEKKLEYGTVKQCEYYINRLMTHPLRKVHRANINFFSAVLKNNTESIDYQTGGLCLAVEQYLGCDRVAAAKEGEGIRDFYQNVVEWCRENQPSLQEDTLQTIINTFNQSLRTLEKPGQVT